LVANGCGSLDLWRSPNCWAGQTVNVNVGDNPQTLVNRYLPSATFSLAPGVHRLQSVQPQSYDVFMGQTGAILSGAGLLTNFSQNGHYWVSHVQVWQAASYPGECNSTHPACRLPEDLFFDNVPKTRVTSLSQVGPGSWYLDYATGTVYMGDDPTGYTVEISLSSYAFSGGAIPHRLVQFGEPATQPAVVWVGRFAPGFPRQEDQFLIAECWSPLTSTPAIALRRASRTTRGQAVLEFQCWCGNASYSPRHHYNRTLSCYSRIAIGACAKPAPNWTNRLASNPLCKLDWTSWSLNFEPRLGQNKLEEGALCLCRVRVSVG